MGWWEFLLNWLGGGAVPPKVAPKPKAHKHEDVSDAIRTVFKEGIE